MNVMMTRAVLLALLGVVALVGCERASAPQWESQRDRKSVV